MSIVNKHDLKSELGVEIVERTLEGLGYTMAVSYTHLTLPTKA